MQNIYTRLRGASPYSSSLHQASSKPGIRVGSAGRRAKSATSVIFEGAAKMTFLTAIAATILFAWQGIAVHVQKFSVRREPATPVATSVVNWVQREWVQATPSAPEIASLPQSVGNSTPSRDIKMSASALINRWSPLIAEASARFNVPAQWIRAVVKTESGGRTSVAGRPITSRTGAMGVMQLMPGTYKAMRAQYQLGANPYNPQDNILAGAAYLHQLYQKYGFPVMFAAYNDGPGHLEERLTRGRVLPVETRNYLSRIVTSLNGGAAVGHRAQFTRPNGSPVSVDVAEARYVRAALPGEYAPGVQSVITIGRVHQGVRESVDAVKTALAEHGAIGLPGSSGTTRLADLITPVGAGSTAPHAKSRRHTSRVRLAASTHGRVSVTYNEADNSSGTMHLHSRHRSHGRG